MREKLQLYTNKTENLNDIGNAQNMNSHIHGDRIYLHEFCPQVEAKLVLQLLNTMTAPPPAPPQVGVFLPLSFQKLLAVGSFSLGAY